MKEWKKPEVSKLEVSMTETGLFGDLWDTIDCFTGGIVNCKPPRCS